MGAALIGSFKESLLKGKDHYTVHLLILTGSDQLLLILKNIIFLHYKTRYVIEEVNCTEPSRSVRFPWIFVLGPDRELAGQQRPRLRRHRRPLHLPDAAQKRQKLERR
jgi:hypothetical protein